MIGSVRPLSDTLEKIRHSAGMDSNSGKRDWLEILGIREHQYRNFLRGRESLPENSLLRLAEFLNLSLTEMLTGQIDYAATASRYTAPMHEFPEKYSIAAFGRRRATIHSLDFIEKRSGWRTRAACLRHFGVNESLFSDPMAPISMRFISDLFSHLNRKHGYTERDFFEIGIYSQTGNRNTVLSETFSRARKPGEVYELLYGEMLKYYEQNCTYALQSLAADSGVVQITSNPYIAEAMGLRALGNPQICAFKAGWISSAMEYLGLPYARVKETACVHRGDPACLYEFDFSEAARAHREKPLSN